VPARRSKTTQSCPRDQHRLGNSLVVVAGRTFGDARGVVHRRTSTRGLPQGWHWSQPAGRRRPGVVPWDNIRWNTTGRGATSARRRPDGWHVSKRNARRHLSKPDVAIPGAKPSACSYPQSEPCACSTRKRFEAVWLSSMAQATRSSGRNPSEQTV